MVVIKKGISFVNYIAQQDKGSKSYDLQFERSVIREMGNAEFCQFILCLSQNSVLFSSWLS